MDPGVIEYCDLIMQAYRETIVQMMNALPDGQNIGEHLGIHTVVHVAFIPLDENGKPHLNPSRRPPVMATFGEQYEPLRDWIIGQALAGLAAQHLQDPTARTALFRGRRELDTIPPVEEGPMPL